MPTASRSFFLVIALVASACSAAMNIGENRDGGGAAPDSSRPGIVRTEACGNGIDDDANGRIDDGCPCGPGQTQACFGGALATREVGACEDGIQTCRATPGSEWGDWGDSACEGDRVAATEQCDGMDHDCDGARDEDCPCAAGDTAECGVEFLVEPCRAGTQTCSSEGVWSTCEGAIGPTTDVCDDGIDNDCDGTEYVGCTCVPEPELCRDSLDNDCDSAVDEAGCMPDWPPVELDEDWCREFESTWPSARTDCGGALERVLGNDWGMAVDAEGNVYVAGGFHGAIELDGITLEAAERSGDAQSSDVFLLSLAPGGSVRWARRFGDAGSDAALDLALDGAGNVYVVGTYQGRVDFGGGPLASTPGFDCASTHGFVASFDSDGEHLWSQGIVSGTGTGVIGVGAIDSDAAGTLAITGYASGTVDLGDGPRALGTTTLGFVAVLEASRELRWARTWPGSDASTPSPHEIQFDPAGGVVVAGSFEGRVDLGLGFLDTGASVYSDIFVAAYDREGDPRWQRQFFSSCVEGAGGCAATLGAGARNDLDLASGLRVGASGNSYITGLIMGAGRTIDFGCGPMTATTTYRTDTFIASLDPEGECRWQRRIGSDMDDYVAQLEIANDRIYTATTIGRTSFPSRADLGDGSGERRLTTMTPFVLRTDVGGGGEPTWEVPVAAEAGLGRGLAAGTEYLYSAGLADVNRYVCRRTL
jgi:hypothetical protein